MVKHNNVIPNQHFHKKWAGGTTGHARGPLHVVDWFDQPAKKKTRRLKRAAKAAAIAPRPTSGPLRPVVHCPTIKYNSKVRLGKGFTAAECKEAGLTLQFAQTIGIAIDRRRTNKSIEAMQVNVQRLKDYKQKLVLFPKKGSVPKNGPVADSPSELTAVATQLAGEIIPIRDVTVQDFAVVPVTDEMKETCQHSVLRIARNEKRMKGIREKQARDKAEAEKKK